MSRHAPSLHELDGALWLLKVLFWHLVFHSINDHIDLRPTALSVGELEIKHAAISLFFFFDAHLVHEPLLWRSTVDSQIIHCSLLDHRIICQRVVSFSYRFALGSPLTFLLIDSFMLFKFLIAADAGEVGDKPRALAGLAAMWTIDSVLIM